ncbi:3-hydroxyacyl-CoA dehydrogenase NAD-binding domain-containing protein [Pollutimonas harenae]|uniref:Enoyl-CoA hydratase/isomerase family protein n=1 Tax=Pollutimonas harenae TaxID=657015 RepID=A0A853GZL1_9BURK|nr:3-hydroxyacyl-CoA dehydrogenase NAD-binding domain-containing protein [Pollutimonas harenae]NYT84485.1 enoyl-CoA hydratase/isomerase family protein [Pollutimonas harenae]TEA73118.1 3-hydroxyacyl-CoA dehydrogenase [Pollutimonas harenae]
MISKQIEVFPGGQVAVLSIQNPPVNGLGSAVRAALGKALDEAIADTDVLAIVLTGAGRFFSGGADIREFNTPLTLREPVLRDIINKLESSPKPTVAAINGIALGGGLELALGCHYRVAVDKATLGLPEVKLGVLPGAGGTQRLPRLIGVEAALEIIASGDAINADQGLRCGLVDQIAQDDLVTKACLLGLQVAGSEDGIRRLNPAAVAAPKNPEIFEQARQKAGRRYRGCVAPLECIACLEKTLTTSLDEGLEFERQRFQVLVNGDQSKAQRHIFFAERSAMKLPDADVKPEPINHVGVVGAGTMGGGIAMSLANAGIPVVLLDRDQAALDRGWEIIKNNYSASVSRKKLDQPQMEQRLALIRRAVDYQELSDVDLVIEAAFEDMAVKREIFERLDALCRPDAILASNTSRLDINELAAATSRPGQVIGTHFFSPANVMRLLEVVQGVQTNRTAIASLFSLARKIGKTPVLVGVCDGFVGNRMVSPYTREAHFLLEEGASPEQVDGALQRFGMAMGPLRMGDMAGLDISWAARKRMAPTRPAHIRYSRVADRICEMGRLGQKTGAGFYRYEEGSRNPVPDPVIDELIKECAQASGIERRDISDEEIIQRTMYALVNEGARILEEGIAQRSSDIDVIYVAGYGFPVFRGGPMFYADTVGLPQVLATIERFHAEHGELWAPAPLLKELASSGRKFSDL